MIHMVYDDSLRNCLFIYDLYSISLYRLSNFALSLYVRNVLNVRRTTDIYSRPLARFKGREEKANKMDKVSLPTFLETIMLADYHLVPLGDCLLYLSVHFPVQVQISRHTFS